MIDRKRQLDALYERWNRRDAVGRDPVGVLYAFDDDADREVAAVVAASLAYGRVASIHRSVSTVLGRLGGSPATFVTESTPAALRALLADFRHRFTSGAELADLLAGAAMVRREYGSLEACVASGLDGSDTVLPGLCRLVTEVERAAGRSFEHLLPSPDRGSACKRLNLLLRWLVRRDAVDPGGWSRLPASKLIVPLDTHMYRVGLALGMTGRRSANLRAALDVTDGFRRIEPADPVRYDFALTRLGVRGGGELDRFLAGLNAPQTQEV